MQPAPLDIEFLTAKDVAELLCVSPRSVWRWAASGQLPGPVRVGPRCTRWRVSDLQRYLDSLPVRAPELEEPE